MATEGEGAKTATAVIQSDGSYTLTTYESGDGAVIGTHRVLYTTSSGPLSEEDTGAAAGDDGEHEQEETESPYVGLIPKEREVEVTSGGNTIDIELIPMQQ
jgi:hypothetical protein